MIVNRSMYPLQQGFAGIGKLQQRLGELQTQLASGDKSPTLAGMGGDRALSLALRARLSAIDGYANTATTVGLRLQVLDNTLTRLNAIEAEARTASTPGGYGSDGLNLAAAPAQAGARLDEVLALLNTDVAGRYMFGGSVTDAAPVQSKASVLDGSGGRVGFRTVAAERSRADLGADGQGRLTIVASSNAVTLAEDGAHPFGLKLSTLSTSSDAVGLTQPAGTPASLTLSLSGQPSAGQSVTVGLTLPDGSDTTLVLTATTGAPKDGEFRIGATVAETATNLAAALGTGLQQLGRTQLAAASAFAAAENFFNGQGEPVLRVDGPPFETATGLVAASADNTVFWYGGGDAPAGARAAVSARLDDATHVEYGVQANEAGPLQLVRTLAVAAIGDYAAGDADAKGRFDAVATRQIGRLAESRNQQPGSIEGIMLEVGVASARLGSVGERHTALRGQLQTLLDGAEKVSIEETAMNLLALQTRLQASYSTTATISQLSLVNYLR